MKRAGAVLALLITVTLAAIMFLTIRAHAAPPPCGPLPVLLKSLADLYHEFVVMSGDATGQQMLVLKSDAGTFSVLLGNGKIACLIMSGEKAQFDNGT
ncbi:hypothetical protein NKI13_24530 [Mesorhizobium australicum]|uniref:hypothetical protein n=1 Tax=Mesorhizobium australicum TaxID=536018 RepID=UPI003337AEF4